MKNRITDTLWDMWCIGSVVGIWPRYIEPRLLQSTQLELEIDKLPPALDGLKILQFSDLHFHDHVLSGLLDKLIRKTSEFQPDIILFTGDFISRSKLVNPDQLKELLCRFSAPLGCYAINGNHDYDQFASINRDGEYDIITEDSRSPLLKGFQRLLSAPKPSGKFTERIRMIKRHNDLHELIKNTPFQLLENQAVKIAIKNSFLNICGLGDYMCGQFDPKKAFKDYDKKYPGVVLSHNPDSLPHLGAFPGDVVLCGHTHGGEINLPWLWKKFTLMENPKRKRGLMREGNKWVYVNRGLGGDVTFRWFSPPEVLCLTLREKKL